MRDRIFDTNENEYQFYFDIMTTEFAQNKSTQ